MALNTRHIGIVALLSIFLLSPLIFATTTTSSTIFYGSTGPSTASTTTVSPTALNNVQLTPFDASYEGADGLQATWTGGTPGYTLTITSGYSLPCTNAVSQTTSYYTGATNYYQNFLVYPSQATYYCFTITDSAGASAGASYLYHVTTTTSTTTSTTSTFTTTSTTSTGPSTILTTSPTTIVEYYVSISSNFGANYVSPTSGYYAQGSTLRISATAPPITTTIGYGGICVSWIGQGSGSYTGASQSANILIINGPISETAHFAQCSPTSTTITTTVPISISICELCTSQSTTSTTSTIFYGSTGSSTTPTTVASSTVFYGSTGPSTLPTTTTPSTILYNSTSQSTTPTIIPSTTTIAPQGPGVVSSIIRGISSFFRHLFG